MAEVNADVVCERTYKMIIDGEARSVPVRWQRPARDEIDWCCEIQIDWTHQAPERLKAYGVDSVQALYLAFQMAASILSTTRPSVFLFEPGDDLHLPHPQVPENADAKGHT